ncbi:MAG: glycosyltransferase family 39 protein, partial [Chlamydiota bacterium]|nr:glycosyltransferase family 39 protein [Chlamydiota bacterium]
MHYSFPVNIMLLAATFILPGPLTILSFYKKSLSLGTFLFFSLLGSIIIISWIGLILAQLAIFSALMLGWILLSYSLILLVIRKPWLRISLVQFPKISPLRMIPVIALFMLISIIYMRPHEYITGHWDPGTYLNTGFNLANSGSLLIHDKLLSRMPTKDQAVFAPSREDLTRTPGFYMKDPHAGQMIPQFYHTYPVWLALFFQYFGAKGALMLNPLFALCSIWTLFLLLKNLFNTKTAYMGLIIFSFNIVQIWNARFATSEVLAQYFILSGIYILYEAKKDHQTLLLTILSSGSFAMAILTRTTSILIIPLLALYLLTKDWCRMRKKDWIFLIPISIGIFHLALQSLYFTKAYVKTMPHFFSGSEEKNALYSYLSIVLITVICSLFRKRIQPILTKEKVLIF